MNGLKYLLLTLLAACTAETGVRPEHIAEATELCSVNGGVAVITYASTGRETESCRGCARITGRNVYVVKATCANGAHVELGWAQ